jgi:hypothetical protein
VHELVAEALSDYEATGAEESYDLTLLLVDGERTVEEVVAASPLPDDYAVRFLAACHVLGCTSRLPVQRTSAARRASAAPEEPQGAVAEGEPATATAAAAAELEARPRPRPRPKPQPETEGSSARWWLVLLLVLVVLSVVVFYGWKGGLVLGGGDPAAPPEGEVGAPP